MHKFTFAETIIVFTMLGAYIALTTWLTVALRSKSSREFIVAARALPAGVVGFLLMSEFVGAKSTVGTAQEAFHSGMAAAWSVIGVTIGYVLFGAVIAKKIYASGAYTISGAIGQKYGKSTMVTVSVIMIYAMILVNVANILGGAAALAEVMNVNLPIAMTLIAIVSTIYTVIGGMKGVAWVTVVHTLVKVAGVIVVVVVALKLTKGVAPMVDHLPSYYFTWDGKIGLTTIIAWTMGTLGAIFSTQHIIQATLASRSPAEAQRASYYAAAMALPLGFLFAIIGVAARYLYPSLKDLYALPVFLGAMSLPLAGFVAMAILASVLISVTTVGLGISSLIMRDFYVPWKRPTQEQELTATRWLSVVVGLAPLPFVFWAPQILELSFFTRALRLSIAIIAVVGFSLPFFASNRGATLGLIAAAVLTTLWYLWGDPFGIDNMYVAMFVPVVALGLDWLFHRGSPDRVKGMPVPEEGASS